MNIFYVYDEDMNLEGQTLIAGNEDAPENSTQVAPPSPVDSPYYEEYGIGFLRLKFDKEEQKWYDEATEEEILLRYKEIQDAKANAGKSDSEYLKDQNAMLLMQVATLEMQNQEIAQSQADMLMQLAMKGVL